MQWQQGADVRHERQLAGHDDLHDDVHRGGVHALQARRQAVRRQSTADMRRNRELDERRDVAMSIRLHGWDVHGDVRADDAPLRSDEPQRCADL
jgi:hypothetical protein